MVDVLGFVPAGSVSSSATLHGSSDTQFKPLVVVALSARLSARPFPLTSACPGQYTQVSKFDAER